jgi:hypothetical protein
MSSNEVIEYLNNQINDLYNKQGLAIQKGDLQLTSDLEKKIEETKQVLTKLLN